MKIFTIVTSIGLLYCLAVTPVEAQGVRGLTDENTLAFIDSLTSAEFGQSAAPVQSEIAPIAYRMTEYAPSESAHCGGCSHGRSCSHEPSICNRPLLTGDWWGRRSGLAEHGLAYKASITQFYQGVTSGGAEQRFRYGDKIDQYFIFDSEKLGLWKGAKLIMHADSQLGQNSIADAAALAPVNSAMLLPLPAPPVTAITHFQLSQELGGGFEATAGKYNFLDLWEMLYPETGRGVDGFMNVSILAPLNVIPTLPIVFNAAGLMKVGERGIEAGMMAIDPRNTQTTSGVRDMFDNGVTIFAFGRLFTDVGGLPGSHFIAATYATGEYTQLDRQGWHVYPGQGIVPSTERGSWLAAYVLDQKLWVDRCDKARSISLFGYAGFSDPEASPYDWTLSGSLQAFSPLRGRKLDRMGVGYFYTGLSEDFKSLPGHLLPLQDLQGGEIYYNAAITPWFQLTTDLQVIQSEVEAQDTAWVLGFRAKMDL